MPKRWGTVGGIFIGGEGNKKEPTLGDALFKHAMKVDKKIKSKAEETTLQKAREQREQLEKREKELRQTQSEVADATIEDHKENKKIMQSVRMREEQRNRGKFSNDALQEAIDKDHENYQVERAARAQNAEEAGEKIGNALLDLPVENTLESMRGLGSKRENLKNKKGDTPLPKKLKREEKDTDGFQPEKIDHDIFDEWRDENLEQKQVLPLLKKTILRFNEVLLKNISHAREWAKEARILYDKTIDPNKGAAWRYVGAFPTVRAHKAWALDTFLQSAVDALGKNKPIPEDTTYYRKAGDKQDISPTAERVKEKSVGAEVIDLPAVSSVTSVEPEAVSAAAIDKQAILKWVNRLDADQESKLRDTQFYKACLVRENEAKKQGNLEQFFQAISRKITDLSFKRQQALALFLVDRENGNVQESSALAPESAKEPQAHDTFARVEAAVTPLVTSQEQKEQQNKLKWIAGVASEKDNSHRVNQDASYVNAEDCIIAVFDGMGGYANGEIASREAWKVLEERAEDLGGANTVALAREILKDIFNLMSKRVEGASKTGGTTATVAKIVQEDGKQIAVVGNLGDSRAYVFRAGTQTLEQITVDDDLLAQVPQDDPLFEDVGEIRRILSDAHTEDQLTDQNELASKFPDLDIAKKSDGIASLNQRIKTSFEIRNPDIGSLYDLFYFRNIISKHVDKRFVPAIIQTELAPGDIIFCTSDGIHDNLTRELIQRTIINDSDKNPSDIARVILQYAQTTADNNFLFRHKPDDMTVVILKSEGTAIAGLDVGEYKPSDMPTVESGADTMVAADTDIEIEETQIYKDLGALYSFARDNDIARGELLRNWHSEAADAKIETERIRAIRSILAQIGKGEFGVSAGGGGTAPAAHPDTRAKDILYARLRSLLPDIAARKDIHVGNEFNVKIIGKDTFPKAEIEEKDEKIEIRLPDAKRVISRRKEIGRVYKIRIVKTNQSKEKKYGGDKHYWHEAEIIGPNLEVGDAFEAVFEPPKKDKQGQYLCFAPDGLPVFVNGPVDLDRTKKYEVTITRAADFSGGFGAWRNHQGVAEDFNEFGRVPRAGNGTADLPRAERKSSALLEWNITSEKKAELDADRALFMQVFSEGIVTRGIFERDDETNEARLLPRGNLDAEACVFLLQNFFQLPAEYLAKTSFVRPGEYKPNALNVDTGFETTGFQVKWFSKNELAEKGLSAPNVSDQKEEDKGGAHVVIVQDHGLDANRTMSAFKLLYDALIDRYGEDAIPPAKREPMKNFVKFVTHIDNFTAPTADFDWKKAWEESDKIPFTLALSKQNFLDVLDLYKFFQKHPFEDAFKRPSEWVVERVTERYPNGRIHTGKEKAALDVYGFGVLGRERKDRDREPIMQEQHRVIGMGERYFEYIERNESEFIVESSLYGKILVVLDGDHVPGRLAAAMAHGIDGMLEWRPGSQSFWFNVAPQKNPADYGVPQIPQQLAEETGGVWVRGSIVTHPDWKKQDLKAGLNLGAFLKKIGAPLNTLRGRLLERVTAEDNSEKPWETVPNVDFFTLKAELKEAIYVFAPEVLSVDPNQRTVNEKKEDFFIKSFKRPNDFKNYPINAWVMAAHDWFNDQIMDVFGKWLDKHILVESVDAFANTITEKDGKMHNKNQFLARYEKLPSAYSKASHGLWKGAVNRWFDSVVSGKRAELPSTPEPARTAPAITTAPPPSFAQAGGSTRITPDTAPAAPTLQKSTPAPPAAPTPERARLMPATGERAPATLEPNTLALVFPERTGEPAPAEAAVSAALGAEAQTAQVQEDARIADAQAELGLVTERLARARAAKEQYEGIVKGFAGFITGKGSQAGAEYDAALQEYQETLKRVVGGALEESLKWRTHLVEKMIDAKLATPEKKGLGVRAVELWKSAGEVSLYNYIEKKGGWRDKRGFVWGSLKILSKAANLRTATALSLFGGGWVAGATAVGWSAAGAGAGLSALGSGIGFNEWTRHGYEIGRTSGKGARAQVFKDQAEAEAHYQAEYASAGRFKKFWRGLSGQGFSAEGAAVKAVWLEKLGKGNVTGKRIAIEDRLFAFEADAMLYGKKDLLNDASYQKLVEAYKEAIEAEEQAVGGALDGYFESQGKEFIKELDYTIGGEKSALRRRKVFSAFAGATLGLASLANFDVRSYVRGLGSEGKPPVGIVSAEDGSSPRVTSLPSGSEGSSPVSTGREETPLPRAGETASRTPSGAPPVETTPAARSPFADLIYQAQGERAWTGVRKIAGGEYAHIVPQKGHRAVIQAVKELLHKDPQKFGMGAHPSDALVEAKATAIARKLGFMGHGYSLGFKFDAGHPIGLFAKDGQISVVAENEKTLHRLMGAVKRGGGVMKPDVARPYVDDAFPKIRAHAIFVEGQSGAPVDATQVRVSAGVGHHVAPRAEDFGAGRGTGALGRADALRGVGVSTGKALTAGELASHAGAAAGRGARGAGEIVSTQRGGVAETTPGTRAGTGGGVSGAGTRADGGGGVSSATETVPAVDARPVFVRVIDGLNFEASGSYKPAELARIKELAEKLARQKTSVDEKLAFLQSNEAGKKLAESFKPKTQAFKDLLETFKHKIFEGKASVRELEGLVNSSPLKEAAVSEVVKSAAVDAIGAESVLPGGGAVEKGIAKIASASRRIVSDPAEHFLSVWDGKAGSAVSLELPAAFEVTLRSVRGEPLAVGILTPGGQRLKGVIKFVKGVARVIFTEGGKKRDMLWKEFIKKY